MSDKIRCFGGWLDGQDVDNLHLDYVPMSEGDLRNYHDLPIGEFVEVEIPKNKYVFRNNVVAEYNISVEYYLWNGDEAHTENGALSKYLNEFLGVQPRAL